MCGIGGIVGNIKDETALRRMLEIQHHRGPDAQGLYISPDKKCGLLHNRLSIIDLSEAGTQPIYSADGRYKIIFNGEAYNYLEVRKELENDFRFQSHTDTEVVLNAYIKYGADSLNKFYGMFAYCIWDEEEKTLFVARDRFGVKPFNYAYDKEGNFVFASEIKTLFAAGISKEINEAAWASYLAQGRYDHDENTFWKGIHKLPAGSFLYYKNGELNIKKWYDLADKTNEIQHRPLQDVIEEYYALLQENVRLRFRADVPVGINLSGGLDSSALLAIVDKVQGEENTVKAFTFYTGDDRYDELPWVNEMIKQTHHPLYPCLLKAEDVPSLADSVQWHQDEPYGGLPTLAYARLFEVAREQGVIVLLDGQGMDEQWAGYDYYAKADATLSTPTVQGTTTSPVAFQSLNPDFAAKAESWSAPEKYSDKLRNLQYRDAFFTKIPRALRFNDRISMRRSTELREPFLDHRLFEIAFCQPEEFKIKDGQRKYLMRQLLKEHLPGKVVEAPKRPLQTPQREWLRGELKDWAYQLIESALQSKPGWFNKNEVWKTWNKFQANESDNSFYIWQWLSISLMKL